LDLETFKMGDILAVVTEPRKSQIIDSSKNAHFPKMDVVNVSANCRF